MSGEGVMANQGNWAERATDLKQLTWKAVRAAIWAAGEAQDAAKAQSAVKSMFNRLDPCTLQEAHKQLDANIALGGTKPADKNPLFFMGEGARLAKAALDKEMGVAQGMNSRAD